MNAKLVGLNNQVVDISNFIGLTSFLKELGLNYNSAKIEDLEYVTMDS